MVRFLPSEDRVCVAIVTLCCLAGAPRAIQAAATVTATSPLHVEYVESNVTHLALDAAAYRRLEGADQLSMTDFALPNHQVVTLDLRRIEVFTPDATIVAGTPNGDVPLPRPDVRLFGGTIAGKPESIVFLSLSPHAVQGMIQDAGKVYLISSGAHGAGGDIVIYDSAVLSEDRMDEEALKCGSDALFGPDWNPDDYIEGGAFHGLRGTGDPVRTVRLAIETDWEFTGALFGGNTDASSAYAATLIGAVGEIYMRDVSSLLRISYLRVWADSNDPWTSSDTSGQLVQFRSYWNSQMSGVSRHIAHFLSARGLGGGIAYVGALCANGWGYALSANLAGTFPYPLQDNHSWNWTPFVVAHELGHNFGAPHTHNTSPPIDGCGFGNCSVTPNGTIMSYCHQCSGGMRNILLRFHDQMISQYIMPYLNNIASCDFRPEAPVASATTTNRYLIFEPASAGLVSAIHVELITSDDFPGSVGATWWVGAPDQNGVSRLVAEPVYRDWGAGSVYVADCGIVPVATYAVRVIADGWAVADADSYSQSSSVATTGRPWLQFWGDLVGQFNGTQWTAPDGIVNFTDISAAVAAFQDVDSAPHTTRMDLHPQTPNFVVNFSDINLIVKAFQSRAYPYSDPGGCP